MGRGAGGVGGPPPGVVLKNCGGFSGAAVLDTLETTTSRAGRPGWRSMASKRGGFLSDLLAFAA